MAIEVRLLKDNEAALANDFFNNVYSAKRSMENFNWEFFNGPKGKAIYVVAVDTAETTTTKIVGIQCAIPLELISANGTPILTAKSEDTLVDPGYRGQKLFERMYDLLFQECTKAGIKYIWGFTPALKAFERIGFQAPFVASQALMVLNPFSAYRFLTKLNPANKLLDKIKIAGLVKLSFAKQLTKSFSSSKIKIETTSDKEKQKTVQEFYSDTPYYFLNMESAYLKWRLLQNPFRNNYINIQSTDQTADILINHRRDVGYIEQMLFSTKSDKKNNLNSIKAAIAELSKKDVGLIRALCFANNDEMRNQIHLLEKAGFVHIPRGNHFVWKSLDESNALTPDKLFLTRLFTQGNL